MKKNIMIALAAIGFCGICATTAMAQDLDQAATKLFDDHRAIAQAYGAYYAKYGSYAANVSALVADGLLQEVPAPDCNSLLNCTANTSYEFRSWGDNDGNGTPDIVLDVIDGGTPPLDLCVNFNGKHTALGNKIFKNSALGRGGNPSAWPETDKSFCVCWADGCDVDPTNLKPGEYNIMTLLSH